MFILDSNYNRNNDFGGRSGGGGPSGGGNNGNFMPNNNMGSNAWGGGGGGGGGGNSNNNRNLDMPNLQALGINPGGNQNQGSNMNPPMGLNLNALPMNPAIVAAALNQWGSAMGGLLNGMQNQGNNDQVSIVSTTKHRKLSFVSLTRCFSLFSFVSSS